MNKRKKISLFMLIAIVLLTGCSTGGYNYTEIKEKYNCIDSVVDYSIHVPKSTKQNEYKVFFNAPFYRVCIGDDNDMEMLLERDSYEIGEEVQLIGENVEMLNGTEVTIHATRLKDCINYDDYCFRMAYYYGIQNLNKGYEEAVDDEVLRSFRKIISNINDDYILITVNINFNGCIYDNIKIENIDIPSLGFQFDFRNFLISTFDFADGDIEDSDNAVIDYSAGLGGIFADAALSNIGYVEIAGDVKKDIESISVKSLDDAVTVITADNYSMYTELMDTYGILYEKHPERLEKGSAISEEYSYVCNDIEDEADAKMSNILVRYSLKDGTVFNKFVYQPRVVDGPYLLSKVVDECMK